jgi:preprotein translocase subunit SecF
VGTIVAAYSTIFVAAPLYSLLRENEPAIKARDERVVAARGLAGTARLRSGPPPRA